MTTCPSLRIGILGTRGIPASYGGFETFAEELSTRLVARGHSVTVYGRRRFFDTAGAASEYKGVAVRRSPTCFHKYLETPLAGLTSFLDVSARSFDAVLICNAANSPMAWVLNLKGIPYAVNVDGIERNRAKWNSAGKLWYRFGEWCTVKLASRVVADAAVIEEYYLKTYGAASSVIPYGARAVRRPAGETLARLGLAPQEYILYVSRLERENNALGVVSAYRQSEMSTPLVIVGDAPYAREYIEQVRAEASGLAVIFAGFQFGDAYQELQSNCSVYIQATEVGGTHPALVEAMAYGNLIIANDTPENREVLGPSGLYYAKNDFADLARNISRVCSASFDSADYRRQAHERASALFDWEKVTDSYEELLLSLTRKGESGRK